ncbi:GntR family transcriptional regulator [Agathobaculum sp.]|uniref:GntR family transcriptional regulator n=1 Tax=Agathobaculum sp. TaxID=2048138 RepID=UPI002A81F7FB|nr:GntR family transcriptional regulator [Agathobaculum sp.]MDY3619526.1 GntR family transcriptional regulator [Agathobaculum sp.]
MSPTPRTKEYAAYEAIRAAIISGELQPGQQVSIRELAARFDFGRTPAADAMKRLAHEGWLESAAGVGTRVARLDLADRYEYMQLRGAIEVLAARLCAERATPEMALDFDHCLAVAALAIEQKNWLRAIEADIEFHRLCAEKSGNRFLAECYGRLLTQDERVFYRNLPDPDARIQSHRQHAAIVEAIRTGDPEGAALAAQNHTDTILQRLKAEQKADGT